MPLISVVMPAFNAAPTLGAAISSTLLALPRDGEIIVINDGSGDSTLRVAEQARSRDKRVRIIDSGVNRGIVAALNTGFNDADCRYLARMDADDICLPWRLRYAVASLKKNKSDIVFTSVASFSSYTRIRPAAPIRISTKAMGLHLLLVNPVAHSTMVGIKDCFESLGGYRDVPSEDYDLWMRAAACGTRIERLAVPSQLYRKHPGQITAQPEWQNEAAGNSLTASSHRQLCKAIVGEDLGAYVSLRNGRIEALEVRQLFESVRRASAQLNAYDKAILDRQLRITKVKYSSDSEA